MARLVQAHEDVAFAFSDDARDEFVGTEGAVSQDEVAFINVLEQARGNACVVLGTLAGFKSSRSAVTEIDDANQAHEGKSTPCFLAAVLRVFQLIGRGIHEGDAGAVDGFEHVAPPSVASANALAEGLLNAFVNLVKIALTEASAGLAIGAGIAAGDRKLMGATPGLHEAHRFGATGIGFQNLCDPSPEDRGVSVVSLATFGFQCFKKTTGKHVPEKHGISTQGIFNEALAKGLNHGLRATLGGGKYGVRKAGEDGLFGHTFKPYPNRLFVLFYQEKFPEIGLNFVPFLPGIPLGKMGEGAGCQILGSVLVGGQALESD